MCNQKNIFRFIRALIQIPFAISHWTTHILKVNLNLATD